MDKKLTDYMQPRPEKKNAQAAIDKQLHELTSKNLKRFGGNWVKLIESACIKFNEEVQQSAPRRKTG